MISEHFESNGNEIRVKKRRPGNVEIKGLGIMKKFLSSRIILLPLLATASLLSSATSYTDTMPACLSRFPLALSIVNKNLDGCTPGAKTGSFCTYNFYFYSDPAYSNLCNEVKEKLLAGQSISVSFRHLPEMANLRQKVNKKVTVNGQTQWQRLNDLEIEYSNGRIFDNCAQVFGNSVQCTLSQSGDGEHLHYILTLSKNS